MTRDLLGYGGVPIKFRWPNGGLVAVNIAINYEVGAEACPADGDETSETWTEYPLPIAPGERDLTTESVYEYGSRQGIWRLLDVLDQPPVVASAFAAGRALERNAAVARAMADRGYDFVGHGYHWSSPLGLDEGQERAEILTARRVIHELTGFWMRGWFTRPPQSPNTRRILAQEGFLFDSDSCNDDAPYFTPVLGRPFLVVPYTQDVNDGRFWRGQSLTAQDFGQYAIDTLDMMVRQANRLGPALMTLALHPRIVGRPGRLAAVERFVAHAQQLTGVWIATRTAVAEAWAGAFAPADAWNWYPPTHPRSGDSAEGRR